MIIQALPQFSNSELSTSIAGKLKFNGESKIEVKDDVAAKLLKAYPSILFDPKAEIETIQTPEEKYTEEIFNRLNNEISSLKENVSNLKSQKAEVSDDLKAWKDKYVELEKICESLNDKLLVEKEVTQKVIDDCNSKISLYSLTESKLKKICIDLKYPEEEWTNLLKDKEKLIEYLLAKK